ncbi:MAG: hypothetical protein C0596_01325 [Marinilabiliales bacterium]|nr:MAG: hypothetical protein C0596_01325 [Marinilabiliales bacterium]
MKKFAIILTIVAATAMIFSSCGKYEEGPAFSLLTKKARITGTWTLSEMTIDGEVQDLAGMTTTTVLEKDGTGSMTASFGGFSFSADIEWEFDDTKENLRTRTYDADSEEWSDWSETKITKLTNSECWMEDSETVGEVTVVTVTKMTKE